ncbi:hypothetical protein D1007_06504 [Hordeum vulgare]|nr:hypothetical protein D1007_06504 [Hordeum vulgare]
MAVADAALPCPPTPPLSAWIVVVAVALVRLALTPMLVRFALTPMLMLVRVLCVLAGALACLFFATAWVTSAASAAQVVAGRAWGEGSAPFLFLQELMYGAFKVCVYSFLVFLALAVLLVCVAYVIAVVSGSTSGFKKGEMVGSVMEDVGIFGMHATACVMIPAVVLGLWRDCQADRKAPSQFSLLCVFFQEAAKKHHHLDLNTLRGHTDCITVLDFSSDACNLATDDPLLKAIRGDTLSAALVRRRLGVFKTNDEAVTYKVLGRTPTSGKTPTSGRFLWRRLPTLPMLRSSRSGTLRVHGLEEQQQGRGSEVFGTVV